MYSLAEGISGVQFGGGKVWCTVWRREGLVYSLAEGRSGVQFGGGKLWCTVWRREAVVYSLAEGRSGVQFGGGKLCLVGNGQTDAWRHMQKVPRPSRPRTTELGGTNITTGNTATTTNIANKRNKIKDKNENVS